MDEQEVNLEDVRLVLEQALELVSPYKAWTVNTEIDRDTQQVCSLGALKLAQIGGWDNVKDWYSMKASKLCYENPSFHYATKLLAKAIFENHPRIFSKVWKDELIIDEDERFDHKTFDFEELNFSQHISIITGFNDRSYTINGGYGKSRRLHGNVIDVFAKALKSVIQEMEEVSA